MATSKYHEIESKLKNQKLKTDTYKEYYNKLKIEFDLKETKIMHLVRENVLMMYILNQIMESTKDEKIKKVCKDTLINVEKYKKK